MPYENEMPINAIYYLNNNTSDYNVFLNNYNAHSYTEQEKTNKLYNDNQQNLLKTHSKTQ